ncbi:MAG TPA: hypothetical protein VMY16_11695 [Ilumatobacteraceae bacterium]|nr:hypothetical protein [Ilumatobacteraceae bacterium]
MTERYPRGSTHKPGTAVAGRPTPGRHPGGLARLGSGTAVSTLPGQSATGHEKGSQHMGYGIGGVLILILVILAIIYFAKRV